MYQLRWHNKYVILKILGYAGPNGAPVGSSGPPKDFLIKKNNRY